MTRSETSDLRKGGDPTEQEPDGRLFLDEERKALEKNMAQSNDVPALVRRRLLRHFDYQLPSTFARAAGRMIEERLRADGEVPEGLVDAALLRGCDLMLGYLEGGGKVELPESLFQSLACQALEEIRRERAQQVTIEVMRLLEGEVTLEDSPLKETTKILDTVRQALGRMPERFARFLRLDLLEHRSDEEICVEMGLSDHEEYLHLKRLSLQSLRRAIERLLLE